MRFQLVATISDSELLRKCLHELGTIFYQKNGDGKIAKVVYFSGSRVVEFNGVVDKELAKRLKAEGHEVDSVEVDEAQGYVKVVQVSE